MKEVTTSVLTKKQTKYFDKGIRIDGKNHKIYVTVRYDDECNNGHNTFTITGDIYSSIRSKHDKYFVSGGCIHEEIAKYFPELRHLIKWHLMNSNGPMHYIENTLFHARDKDHENVEVGEPVEWETRLKFEGFPVTFEEQQKGFWDYLDSVGDFNNIFVEEIIYDDEGDYVYAPHYSLTGFIKENQEKQWYLAPFQDKTAAEEFLEALRTHSYGPVKFPTKFCQAVEPDLESARASAVWEDATLEQLQNRQLLKDRLPKLLEEFRSDIEKLGFVF